MNVFFENLYFVKINFKNDQLHFEKKNDFSRFFYAYSFLYHSFLTFLIFFLNKNEYYDNLVFADFLIGPMKRIFCFHIGTVFLLLFSTELSKKKFLKTQQNLHHLKFLFLQTSKDKRNFKVNKICAQNVKKIDFKAYQVLKISFLFYKIKVFFLYLIIAYFKLKKTEISLVFVIKILLYIHLYLITLFGIRICFFELTKQFLILNYISSEIKYQNIKLIELNKNLSFASTKNLKYLKLFNYNLKKIIINYNRIIIEKKLLKQQDVSFGACFLICILYILIFLVSVIFFGDYNFGITIISSSATIFLLIGMILPLVILNVMQNNLVNNFLNSINLK